MENVEEMKKICEVEEVFHVSGDLNIADLGTRPGVNINQIGPDSLWQCGPEFLSLEREMWPVTRPSVNIDVPKSEQRTEPEVIIAAVVKTRIAEDETNPNKPCYVVRHDTGSVLNPLLKNIEEIMNYSYSLKVGKRIVARLIKTWQG